MENIYRFLSIIIMIISMIIIILMWLWYRKYPHRGYFINWWNRRIKYECDMQDAYSLNGIPSYYNAWNSPNTKATELHRLIRLNHDEILTEVMELLKNHNSDDIWVRIMNKWVSTADKLPTLKRITSLFPEISGLHVSIFNPGTTLLEHRGVSRTVQRYHYGLKIPAGDVGLKIDGYNVKWVEKEGFVWDDTLLHSAWNHTDEARIVIFADIFRDLSVGNKMGSYFMHSLFFESKM